MLAEQLGIQQNISPWGSTINKFLIPKQTGARSPSAGRNSLPGAAFSVCIESRTQPRAKNPAMAARNRVLRQAGRW